MLMNRSYLDVFGDLRLGDIRGVEEFCRRLDVGFVRGDEARGLATFVRVCELVATQAEARAVELKERITRRRA